MKKILIILTVSLLSGCAGLNVQWAATATYNTPAITQTTMNPGNAPAEKPVSVP